MKLYTEEQVRRLIEGYYDVNWIIQDAFDELEPIELPSDEEEEKFATSLTDNIQQHAGFNRGVKWMKEQILNQNGKNYGLDDEARQILDNF